MKTRPINANEIFMEQIFDSSVKEHFEKWINAWNNKDSKNPILFSEAIQFYSQNKNSITKSNSEIIMDKKDLEQSWSIALNKFNKIHFTSKEYLFNCFCFGIC